MKQPQQMKKKENPYQKARLNQALRENLRKRKQQLRTRCDLDNLQNSVSAQNNALDNPSEDSNEL